jgi:hypothetical protein
MFSQSKEKMLGKMGEFVQPKCIGALGVLALRMQNSFVLMKNMFSFMSQQVIPWFQLIWNAHCRLNLTPCNSNPVGLFWWIYGLPLWDKFWDLSTCIYIDMMHIKCINELSSLLDHIPLYLIVI